jgi:hypothetical protein
MSKSKSRMSLKQNAYEKKDDDYETTSKSLECLIPYINENQVIYDPFYCNGLVVEEWKKLDRVCINEDKNAFDKDCREEWNVLVSNIPFSMKKQCMELAFSYEKPFALLMPIDSLGSKWIKKYFDKIQVIIPDGRWSFTKKGKPTAGCWFDTCWITYNLNLPEKMIKL